jgi:hypothetical protein
MSKFTKEKMISDIKNLRELLSEKELPSPFFYNNFTTLRYYGVMRELCQEGFIIKIISNRKVFYQLNWELTPTANDYDYFYAKALRQRNAYTNKKRLIKEAKVIEEKKQTKINLGYEELVMHRKNITENLSEPCFMPYELSLDTELSKSNEKVLELESSLKGYIQNIAFLNNEILVREEKIKELESQLKNVPTKVHHDSEIIEKNIEARQTKYLKILGIKIYEKK